MTTCRSWPWRSSLRRDSGSGLEREGIRGAMHGTRRTLPGSLPSRLLELAGIHLFDRLDLGQVRGEVLVIELDADLGAQLDTVEVLVVAEDTLNGNLLPLGIGEADFA